MTGKLLSLSRARKARDRTEKRRAADENAVRFGRSKAEKAADDAARVRAEKNHVHGKLERE